MGLLYLPGGLAVGGRRGEAGRAGVVALHTHHARTMVIGPQSEVIRAIVLGDSPYFAAWTVVHSDGRQHIIGQLLSPRLACAARTEVASAGL